MAGRIDKLDSIRGIAAMAVVLQHCWVALPPAAAGSWRFYVGHSPLMLLADGDDAVVVFFVLSGLVLAPPFLTGERRRYWPFAIKRICRIWIPFAVVLIGAIALYARVDLVPTAGFILERFWRPDLTPALVARNLFLTGLNGDLDFPTWTLVHEMRISLIFPFLMLLVARLPWRAACLLAAAFSIAVSRLSPLDLDDLVSGLAESARWVCFFVFGAVMAKHAAELRAWFSNLPLWQKLALAGVALVLMYPETRQLLTADPTWIRRLRWLNATGAVLVFLVATNSRRIGTFLERWPLVFLGRISYGIFLVHAPILIAATHAAVRPVSLPVAVALVPVVTIAAATVLHRVVELPAIALGRRLAQEQPGLSALTIPSPRA